MRLTLSFLWGLSLIISIGVKAEEAGIKPNQKQETSSSGDVENASEKAAAGKVGDDQVAEPVVPVQEKGNFKYIGLGLSGTEMHTLDGYRSTYNVEQERFKTAIFSLDMGKYASFGGLIEIDDTTNDLKDVMLKVGLKDYIFRLEYGSIKGRISYDDEASSEALADTKRTFNGEYRQLLILDSKPTLNVYEFFNGWGLAKYDVPIAVTRGNNGTGLFGEDNLYAYDGEVIMAGYGIHKDTLISLQRAAWSGEHVMPFDWYFDTTTIIGLGRVSYKSVEASETQTNNKLEGDEEYGLAVTGTYEIGLRYIQVTDYFNFGAKLGFQLKNHMVLTLGGNSSLDGKDPSEQQTGGVQHIFYGPRFEVSASF